VVNADIAGSLTAPVAATRRLAAASDLYSNAVPSLSRTARTARLGLAAAVVAVTLFGTVHGQDDWFPFGPFRMYSTRDNPDAPVKSTLMQGVTPAGRRITINGTETGLRRAEVEGQLGRFEQHPELLATIANAYQHRHSGQRLSAIEIVVRDYGLHGGAANGAYTQKLLARWSR
jgi:hypothetical protein